MTAPSTESVASLKKETEELRARVEALEAPEEVVVLRTVGREQAIQEILELFRLGGTLYYSAVARRLRLDLAFVVEICQELEAEGEIETGADAV